MTLKLTKKPEISTTAPQAEKLETRSNSPLSILRIKIATMALAIAAAIAPAKSAEAKEFKSHGINVNINIHHDHDHEEKHGDCDDHDHDHTHKHTTFSHADRPAWLPDGGHFGIHHVRNRIPNYDKIIRYGVFDLGIDWDLNKIMGFEDSESRTLQLFLGPHGHLIYMNNKTPIDIGFGLVASIPNWELQIEYLWPLNSKTTFEDMSHYKYRLRHIGENVLLEGRYEAGENDFWEIDQNRLGFGLHLIFPKGMIGVMCDADISRPTRNVQCMGALNIFFGRPWHNHLQKR